jgi:hypothetical protein
MMNRWSSFSIILVLRTYVSNGISLFIKWLEVVTASILLEGGRRNTALLIVHHWQITSRMMIFYVLWLSHIYYLSCYGVNKWSRGLFLDVIKIVIRITCSWKSFVIVYTMLWDRLIFWIKLIYILCIDVVNRVTFRMAIPLINLGEHLIQYWHYLLI